MTEILQYLLYSVAIVLIVYFLTWFSTKKKDKSTATQTDIKQEKKAIVMTHKASNITYFEGDVLEAMKSDKEDCTKILIHICNNKGGWGAGFVLALSKVWPQAEEKYRSFFKMKKFCELGDIQVVQVEPKIYVINMIAQNGYKTPSNPIPLKYDALQSCLEKIVTWINNNDILFPKIYGPKFGTGHAGGDWVLIQEYIKGILTEIQVKIYEI